MVLTKEQIAQAALNLLDEEGLDSLTVRKVAEKLNVQHGALYWHVRNKQELLDEVAEAILREEFATLEVPTEPFAWEEWLTSLANRLRKAMLAHRDAARIVATSHSKSRVATISRLGDLIVATLHKAGFEMKIAAIIFYTIVSYTNGLTVQEQGVSSYQAVTQEMENSGATIMFPDFMNAKHELFVENDGSNIGETLFNYGLQLIINGIKHNH